MTFKENGKGRVALNAYNQLELWQPVIFQYMLAKSFSFPHQMATTFSYLFPTLMKLDIFCLSCKHYISLKSTLKDLSLKK